MASNSKNVVLAVLLCFAVSATPGSALFPRWLPIFNVTEPRIQDLGIFAVEQYNKKGEGYLHLKGVYSGKEYFGPGQFYHHPEVRDEYFEIQLQAADCWQSEAIGNYTACVAHFPNITDPTTGLHYVLKSFFRPVGVPLPYADNCKFFDF